LAFFAKKQKQPFDKYDVIYAPTPTFCPVCETSPLILAGLRGIETPQN
jgi:hypothetical protein